MLYTAPQRPRRPCAGRGESGPALPDCCRCGWPNFSESDHVKRDFGDSPAMVLIPGLLKQESLSDADIKKQPQDKKPAELPCDSSPAAPGYFPRNRRGVLQGGGCWSKAFSACAEACFGAGAAALCNSSPAPHTTVQNPSLNTASALTLACSSALPSSAPCKPCSSKGPISTAATTAAAPRT